MQRVFTGSARGCIKMFPEGSRDNFVKVNVFLEKGEELRLIRLINILAI